MKTLFFDLSSKWRGVEQFFMELLEEEGIYEFESYSCYFDSYLISICWLSHRIYEKTGVVNLAVQEINLPFELEIAIYQDSETLIKLDARLSDFDKYLNFINIENYRITNDVNINVINRIMVISEQ